MKNQARTQMMENRISAAENPSLANVVEDLREEGCFGMLGCYYIFMMLKPFIEDQHRASAYLRSRCSLCFGDMRPKDISQTESHNGDDDNDDGYALFFP